MDQIILIFYNMLWKLLRFLDPFLSKDSKIGRWYMLHQKVKSEAFNNDPAPLILFACSSVGEYKRIETIANRYAQSGFAVELSFFSPSGYAFLNSETHNWTRVSLLPFDQKKDVDLFLQARRLSYVMISSNMIWPNFIKGLDGHGIRYSIIGCSYYPESIVQQLFLNWRLSVIRSVEYTFCIDNATGILLSKHLTPGQIKICGEPRLDSILKGVNNQKENKILTQFKGNKKLMVVGSAYKEDVNSIISSYDMIQKAGYKMLIAPHELQHINDMKALLEDKDIAFGLYKEGRLNGEILLLDTMGILKGAYAFAEIAFIGGGWNRGIHNIVEAMVHNCSIVTGPKYSKFPEARFLTERNVLTVIQTSEDLESVLSQELSKTFQLKKLKCYEEWLEVNKSANDIIIDTLEIKIEV